jgi:DNA-binding LacI/PurR family transcriptional regulator
VNVTMADVAREAGVSLGLVSRAFRGPRGVKPETRTRILATAKDMGYQPNSVAARLASKGNPTLGVFLVDLHNEVYVDMYDGIQEAAREAGRELVIAAGSVAGDMGRSALDALVRARVDVAVAGGLLISDAVMSEFYGRLRLVSVVRVIDGFDAVDSDDIRGATAATEHLLALGHRRITHLASPPSDGYGRRLQGYQQTMSRAGLEPRVAICGYARAAASEATDALLDAADPPTAIFSHNDQTALGVLDAIHHRGLQVPGDISVVGYDNISGSRPPFVNLTTVDMKATELGRRAAQIAITRSENPQAPPIIETSIPTLIVRGSTGPPPVSRVPDGRRRH